MLLFCADSTSFDFTNTTLHLVPYQYMIIPSSIKSKVTVISYLSFFSSYFIIL